MCVLLCGEMITTLSITDKMLLERLVCFYFYYVYECFAFTVCVPDVYRETGIRSRGTGVIELRLQRAVSHSIGYWKSNLDLLKDQPVLLPNESSLQLWESKGGDVISQNGQLAGIVSCAVSPTPHSRRWVLEI